VKLVRDRERNSHSQLNASQGSQSEIEYLQLGPVGRSTTYLVLLLADVRFVTSQSASGGRVKSGSCLLVSKIVPQL
jgi:hypothetical protein